jgi:hypothetical protein
MARMSTSERNPEERESRIGAEGTEPTGAPPRSGAAAQRDVDEQLDAALACTFPASDPVGCFSTHDGGCES